MTCRYARSAPPAWREAFMQRFERLSLVIVLGSYAMDNLLFSQAGVGSRVLLLQRAGVPIESVGDSTGAIAEM